jgi:hypothetical protein
MKIQDKTCQCKVLSDKREIVTVWGGKKYCDKVSQQGGKTQ